jgi:hypothetical protein
METRRESKIARRNRKELDNLRKGFAVDWKDNPRINGKPHVWVGRTPDGKGHYQLRSTISLRGHPRPASKLRK